MSAFIEGAGFALVVWLCGRLLRWLYRRETMRILDEWAVRFPGECPICSYHDYGRRSGFTLGATPPTHAHCPNRGSDVR